MGLRLSCAPGRGPSVLPVAGYLTCSTPMLTARIDAREPRDLVDRDPTVRTTYRPGFAFCHTRTPHGSGCLPWPRRVLSNGLYTRVQIQTMDCRIHG